MKNRDGGVLEPQIILKLSVDGERTEVLLLVYSLRSLVWGMEPSVEMKPEHLKTGNHSKNN